MQKCSGRGCALHAVVANETDALTRAGRALPFLGTSTLLDLTMDGHRGRESGGRDAGHTLMLCAERLLR